MKNNKKLIEGAFLIAISVILTRFLSIKVSIGGVEGVRIGIGTLPIIIAGMRYGLWQGAKVGALADILGYLLSPGGVYMPHFTLSSALYGVLPPLIAGKKESLNPIRIIIAVGVTHLMLSMLLVPYFLNTLFGIPYQVIFLPRLISFVINVLILNLLLVSLHKKLNIFAEGLLAH